jgi:hypothetical protein
MEENEIGCVCRTHSGKGNIQSVLGGKPARRKNIILKWFSEEQNAVLSDGFIRPRRRMIGGIL